MIIPAGPRDTSAICVSGSRTAKQQIWNHTPFVLPAGHPVRSLRPFGRPWTYSSMEPGHPRAAAMLV